MHASDIAQSFLPYLEPALAWLEFFYPFRLRISVSLGSSGEVRPLSFNHFVSLNGFWPLVSLIGKSSRYDHLHHSQEMLYNQTGLTIGRS